MGVDSTPTVGHAGLGIAGMHERAALLEGKLTIISEQGQGTIVEAYLPLLKDRTILACQGHDTILLSSDVGP